VKGQTTVYIYIKKCFVFLYLNPINSIIIIINIIIIIIVVVVVCTRKLMAKAH